MEEGINKQNGVPYRLLTFKAKNYSAWFQIFSYEEGGKLIIALKRR